MLFYTNIRTYFDFSNYLCKNIIFYTMEIFSDLKQYAQVQSFKSRLNKKYNCNLDNGDLHYIFEKLNIPFSMMNVRGMNVKYYKRDAVIDAFYRGLLTKEIENLTHNREKTNIHPTFQTPGYGKSIVVNTGNRYYPKNNDNTTEDEYNYTNGENDMEKYSNYLINNVYEGKRNMNKITINENDIKALVLESVKKLLKESYHNSGAFSDNPTLSKLEFLVSTFETKYIDYDANNDSISDWDNFVEGIINLYNKSKELVHFKKYHIKELYMKYGNNEDMFFEDFLSEHGVPSKWEWLDEYLDNPEQWEKMIPSPEELYEMIKEFISWVNIHFDTRMNSIVKELNNEKKYIIDTLNKNIY